MGSVLSRISSTILFYPKVFILLGILIAVGIIYGIYYGFSSAKKTATAEDIGNKLNASYQACDADMCAKKLCKDMAVCTGTVTKTIKQATTVVSGFTSGSGPSDELFVNMQPPTIAHAALNSDGSFDEDTAIIAALKGGIRAFTLQIDMLDKVKSEGFADPGEPTLLYRAPDGSIISKNSGDIGKVATAIANTAFKDTVPSNDEPIILYLHIVRAPNQITEDIQYKSYLGKIATALAPIAPVHLGTTATGNYHRQLQEEMILTTPLAQFGGNVIILCNADTSVFKGDSSTVQPADDLDYWVNMRVYALDSSDKNIGIAREYAGSGEPSAVITSLESISNLSEDKAIAFATKGKTRYVIAIPSTNPDKDTLRTAIKTLGVNMVLLDYLSEEPDQAVEYIKYAYDKNIAWPQKSPALRSI
jgi:hypothetical protein